jgi:DNA-binding GntR family transcriptional regulator
MRDAFRTIGIACLGQIIGNESAGETMVDGITGRLRQAIITVAIRPRERIRVADLERKFGVSHIPIREALRRLQSEGFVRFDYSLRIYLTT